MARHGVIASSTGEKRAVNEQSQGTDERTTDGAGSARWTTNRRTFLVSGVAFGLTVLSISTVGMGVAHADPVPTSSSGGDNDPNNDDDRDRKNGTQDPGDQARRRELKEMLGRVNGRLFQLSEALRSVFDQENYDRISAEVKVLEKIAADLERGDDKSFHAYIG